MPSSLTGPSSSGNITQTTTNPTQAAQLPFLSGLWSNAQTNAQNNPFQYYPGQTLANQDPNLSSGYNSIAGAAGSNASNYPAISGSLNSTLGYGSGAQGNLAATASGSNPFMYDIGTVENGLNGNFSQGLNFAQGNAAPQRQVSNITGQLGNLALGGGLNNQFLQAGTRNLTDTANGSYLNSNPFLTGMFNAAADPVRRQYMTATAPQTDSNYEAAGRYGSGALGNARSQNESNLVTGLGNMASNIYGSNYQNERGLQNSAATTLAGTGLGFGSLQGQLLSNAGQLGLGNINTMLGGLNSSNTALGTQGQLYSNELNAQNQAGLGLSNNATQALGLYPSLASSAYQPGQMQVQAGQGLTGLSQQQIADQMARFYGNIQAPWQTLQQEGALFGQPTTGSNSQRSPLLGPSPLSSALGIGGGLNSLFGSGGVGSGLFGGGAAPMFDAATQASIADVAAGGMGLADVGGGGAAGKGAAEALPFLLAA